MGAEHARAEQGRGARGDRTTLRRGKRAGRVLTVVVRPAAHSDALPGLLSDRDLGSVHLRPQGAST